MSDPIVERKSELARAFAPIAERLAILLGYAHPRNRRIMRQLVGLRLFGPKYLTFIGAHFGVLPRREIAARLFWGKTMMVPNDPVGAELFYLGSVPEAKFIRFLIKHIKTDDVFYDIGASYGFYSLLAHELISSGEIHAFEPLPEVFSYLARNGKTIPHFYSQNAAVSNGPATVTFFRSPKLNTQSTTNPGVAATVGATGSSFSVPAVTLDAYVRTHAKPTIVKIDVEGGEEAVLNGGREYLTTHRPTVVMEVWGGAQGQRFSRGAIELLRSFGYRSYQITETGDLVERPEADLVGTTQGDNFVFQK